MRAAAPQTRFHDDITRTASWRHAALGAVIVAFAAALPSAALRAQSTTRNDARPCTEIEVDAERLACYDRALRSARPAAPAAAADQQARRRNRETEAPAAPTPPAAAVAPAAPAPAPAPAAKAESRHAAKNSSSKVDPPIESVVVVNVRGRAGENTFTTDKGATWVQIDGRSTTLPDLPFAATVKPGFSSSFFLVPTKGRAIRVRAGD